MPTYQLLTDRTLAHSSAITPTTLIHIVYTGDPSQNPAGSSYKAELGQLVGLFSGGTYSGSTFSGGSGNCIADLYVNNVHGCISAITFYDSIKSSGSTVTNQELALSYGIRTSATTSASTALNYETRASGVGSLAQGANTLASNTASHAEGGYSVASGIGSHAEGGFNIGLTIYSGGTASGRGAHAEGALTFATGNGSHAEGFATVASGKGSHAEGGYYDGGIFSGGTAEGNSSHAEGLYTKAQGGGSHAEGYKTTSIGDGSHAEGSGTTAFGNYSHTAGGSTYAKGNFQSVIGKFNLTADTTEGAFIIGNGTSDVNRSNLLFAANSGVTVYGDFSANTISATTYYNLPLGNYGTGLTFNSGTYDLSLDGGNGVLDTISLSVLSSDMTVTGGTYNPVTGTATFTNNSGGTFPVTGFLVGYTDTLVTGATYSNNTFTFRNNTGGTFNVLFNTVTGLTSTGTISANTISATTYQNTPATIQVACSDEVTALVTGNTTTFRMPYNMFVTEVRASLTTAQTAGSTFTVDILNNGSTILSTLITIDNTLKTSKTSAVQPVLSTVNLVDDSEMVVKITQIGNGTARGLKVTILGKRS